MVIVLLSPNIARAFDDAALHLGDLPTEVVANLLSTSTDVTLILDASGKILDMAYSGSELTGEGIDSWIGQPIGAVVSDDSHPKVEATMGELSSGLVSRRREMNFLGEGSDSLPMNCMAVRLGETDRIVLFARDMRGLANLQQRLVNTQISMEREYTRLRQAEACYRLLFQIVGEAVLIVDASTMTVTDANPIASDLLGVSVAKIVGRRATHVFGAKDREAVRALLSTAQSVGRADAMADDTSSGTGGLALHASLFRQADVTYVLVRMLPRNGRVPDHASSDDAMSVIERLPDGFVIVDDQRRVQSANGAFLELIQAASYEQVHDVSIDTWFERSSVDANVLLSNVREHGIVRRFPTVLRGMMGSGEDVDITAVCVPGDAGNLFGLVLRRSGRASNEETPISGFPAQSAEQLTDLIGHMPLKEVVRETTDVVERLCIEAALKLTGDNRASAAQMLGVSRQSLYAKMHRFGLGDLGPDDENSPL